MNSSFKPENGENEPVDPKVAAKAQRTIYILYGVMIVMVFLPLVLLLIFGRGD